MTSPIQLTSLTIAGLLLTSSVFAHGYMSAPAARGYLCKIGGNSQCGAAQWEPQSLEAPSGFPAAGPADGKIASASHIQFAELDAQSADRWTKRDMEAGEQSLSWFFTANHTTRNWRYYITRQDWNPNQPLTRAAFDLTPFCTADGGMVQPPKQVTHRCNVPKRTGYQVILGVWEVGDTTNSFYNVVDVMFKGDGQPTPPWSQGGMIHPSVDLKAGDRVYTRVFDGSGERTSLRTTLQIASNTQGQRNNWTHALASKINKEQADIRAGQKAADGQFGPAYGLNPIYLRKASGLTRVEIQIEQQQPPLQNSISVSRLPDSYVINQGKVELEFSVATQGNLLVSNTVYNHDGIAQGNAEAQVNNSSQTFRMAIANAKAGHHQLVVKGTPREGNGAPVQQTFDMMFKHAGSTPSYDYIHPQSLKSYQAGSKVLQSKNGKVYRCKPFPYSGYCSQWSASATHYEPGVGSHWTSAWDEVK